MKAHQFPSSVIAQTSLVGISTTREVNQVVDTQAVFENNGKFLKAGELTIGAAPEPTLQRTITLSRQ